MYATTRSLIAALLALSVLAVSAAAASAATVPVRDGATAGWVFGDLTSSTPFTFTTAAASIGDGSLYVEPITNKAADGVTDEPGDKFIAALPMGGLVSDLSAISYDFQIAGTSTALNLHRHFFLNVYTKRENALPTTFYDCRFDYVPTTGSTSAFTTFGVTSATTKGSSSADRAGDGYTCPSTLAAMEAGATVSFIAVNIGGGSLTDTGVGGYLDNVVVGTTADSTTYDFEPTPDWNLGVLGAPIDEGALNLAKAGQAIPVKVYVADSDGNPVLSGDPGLTLTSRDSDCTSPTGVTDTIETYVGASTGWVAMGDGIWQLNWKPTKAYAGTCRTISVDAPGYTEARTATFSFK